MYLKGMPEVTPRGYLRIDLADNCNIRCIMCQAYNALPMSAMNFLDFDAFAANTRGELAKWAYIQLGNVAEATIHPRFPDFLRYIRSEAPESCIHIVTNAKILHKYAELINLVGNCLVQISMDSIRKQTHEYIREGSRFDRAMENMARLDTSRNRVLLSFTLMRSNVQEYPDMVEFCRQRGYLMSVFPMILRSENGVVPFNLVRESLWFDREHLETWLKQYYGASYDHILGTAAGASEYVDEFACNAHYQDLNLDARGEVNLCGKLGLGNLGRQTLRALWNSREAGEFRLQVETNREPCMTCDYRQRCLSPSMALLENHFSEELSSAVSLDTRQAIRYDRSISDEEAQWLFLRDVGDKVGIFDIAAEGTHWKAQKIIPLDRPGEYRREEPLSTSSRHELHELMRQDADSSLYVQLLESYGHYNLVRYHGKYWALPLALGHVNLTREGDRHKPGILVAGTLEDVKALCGSPESLEPPRLVEAFRGYNFVSYRGRFWAIPLEYGPYDLTRPENQTREGIRIGASLASLRLMCVFPILSNARLGRGVR